VSDDGGEDVLAELEAELPGFVPGTFGELLGVSYDPGTFGSGGGGGGSGFPATASFEQGVRSGDGLVTITYAQTPQSTSDCKNDGWQNFVDNQGHPFNNQGDCVSFVNHQ
jgi:hypothetical protein